MNSAENEPAADNVRADFPAAATSALATPLGQSTDTVASDITLLYHKTSDTTGMMFVDTTNEARNCPSSVLDCCSIISPR